MGRRVVGKAALRVLMVLTAFTQTHSQRWSRQTHHTEDDYESRSYMSAGVEQGLNGGLPSGVSSVENYGRKTRSSLANTIPSINVADLNLLGVTIKSQYSPKTDEILRSLSDQLRKPVPAKLHRSLSHIYLLFSFMKSLEQGDRDLKVVNFNIPGLDIEREITNKEQLKYLAKCFYSDPISYRYILRAIFPNIHLPKISFEALESPNFRLPPEKIFLIPDSAKLSLKNRITKVLFPSVQQYNVDLSVSGLPDLSTLLMKIKGQSSFKTDNILSSLSRQIERPSPAGYPDLRFLYLFFYYMKSLRGGVANPSLQSLSLPGLDINEQSINIREIEGLAKHLYAHPNLYLYTLKAIFPHVQPPEFPSITFPPLPDIKMDPVDIMAPNLPDINIPPVNTGPELAQLFNIPDSTITPLKKRIINVIFPYIKAHNVDFPVLDLPDLSNMLMNIKDQFAFRIDNILRSLSEQLKIPSSVSKYPDLNLLYLLLYYVKGFQKGNPNVPLETLHLPGLDLNEQSSNIIQIKELAKDLSLRPELYYYTIKSIFPKVHLPPSIIKAPESPSISVPQIPQVNMNPVDIVAPPPPDINIPPVLTGTALAQLFNIPDSTIMPLKKRIINVIFPYIKAQNVGLPVLDLPDLSNMLMNVKDQFAFKIDNILHSLSEQIKSPSSVMKNPDLNFLYLLFYCIKGYVEGNPNVPIKTLHLPGLSIDEESSNIIQIRRLAKDLSLRPELYYYTVKSIFPKVHLPPSIFKTPESPSISVP